jgi:hypothetical protein
MVPISYSVAGEQLHHALASYKRLQGVIARRFTLGLAAVLWRHLAIHERCLARVSDVERFTLATTVPSSRPDCDGPHPLHELVSMVALLHGRHERVLRRSEAPAALHEFSPRKYEPLRDVSGHAVLLIDDTWTKGANAQSAAAALKAAGAETVAAVVIGRYVNRGWRHNDRQLRELPRPFDWQACALCAPGGNVEGGNVPGGRAPGEDAPGGCPPGEDAPGGCAPVGNAPGGDSPGENRQPDAGGAHAHAEPSHRTDDGGVVDTKDGA